MWHIQANFLGAGGCFTEHTLTLQSNIVSTSPISKRCSGMLQCFSGYTLFLWKLTLFSAILWPCAMWHVNVKLQQNFAPIEEWKSTLWDACHLQIATAAWNIPGACLTLPGRPSFVDLVRLRPQCTGKIFQGNGEG